ncbi:lytic transglycosylase domain-containing protein [Candidatus Omnitrophota bacterium]
MKRLSLFVVFLVALLLSPENTHANVPDYIVNAVISVESSNRSWVQSEDGCRGLGQIKRETWDWLCKLEGKPWSFDEAYDPIKNRFITQSYLKWLERYLKDKGHFSWELVFACYNAGPGTVRRYGWKVPPYRETRHYVKKINALLN